MNYDDLTEEQQEIWDAGWEIGWDAGYDVGLENVDCEEQYQIGYEAGHEQGARAEQERIQFVLQLMFDAALNGGQGNKAVQYKQVMELLQPVEIKHVPDDED